MDDQANHRSSWLIVVIALAVFVLAGLLGGPRGGSDVNLIHSLAADRAAHPGLTAVVIPVTNAGGAAGMIALLVIVAGFLTFQRRGRAALVVAGIVLSGRAIVELIKLLVDRPRPAFDAHPVTVTSLSFPSAHAANSMITMLAIALVIVPARMRIVAVCLALAITGVIGSTRPYLGVHWPSDVVGGWAFGIAWVLTLARASHYWRASDAPHAV